MELEVGDVGLEATGLGDERRGQLAFVHQRQEGSLGVGVGQHDVGGNLFAVGQADADGASVARQDALNRRVNADFGAVRFSGARHRLGDSAHASVRYAEVAVCGELVGVVVGYGGDGAGRARVLGVFGVYEDGADFGGFEVFFHQIAHVACEHPIPDGFVGCAAHVGGHLREGGRAFEEVTVEDGRSSGHERLEAVVAV